jgi:hypothetical protein
MQTLNRLAARPPSKDAQDIWPGWEAQVKTRKQTPVKGSKWPGRGVGGRRLLGGPM